MKLNLIHCYRSMNYMCRVMEEKYGIPWLEFNFFGPTKISESLRKHRRAVRRPHQGEGRGGHRQVRPEMQAVIDEYRPRLEGKKVMLYVGGLRPRHTVGAYEDLGMVVVGSGYEFAHADDYERTAPEMPEATVIYDDASEYELEQFVHDAQARPGRLRHQGEVPLPEDGDPVPPDAQLGLLRPVPRLQGVPDLCPRRRHGDQQPDLEAGEVAVLSCRERLAPPRQPWGESRSGPPPTAGRGGAQPDNMPCDG